MSVSKILMQFETADYLVQLIGWTDDGGYTVFTRFKSDLERDDVDAYNQEKSAKARFCWLVNNLMINGEIR